MNLRILVRFVAISLLLFACSNGNDDPDGLPSSSSVGSPHEEPQDSSSSSDASSSSATDPSSSSTKQIFDERDEKKYAYVEIGNQTWMAENLNYGGGDGSIGRCYKDDDDNCNTYGRMYTLDEVACPSGWHLPSKEEWLELLDFVAYAGAKLKASYGWENGNGTDDYGFAALPGGYCGGGCPVENSSFTNIGTRSFWWSSSVAAPAALSITFDMGSGASVGEFQSLATSRFYVRCVINGD